MDLQLLTEVIKDLFPELSWDECVSEAYEIFHDTDKYLETLSAALK